MMREPRSEFIGRHRELETVDTLLSTARLVTLTGVGGTGKTRLAMRAGNDFVTADKATSVCFVALESVQDPTRLALAVARALRVTDQSSRDPREVIIEALVELDALIVLDNCEHLIEPAADLVDDLLDALPRLRILATSRRPLDLVGEHVFSVPSLSLTADAEGFSDATTLLMTRARAAGVTYELSAHDREAAMQLCRSLDGLPLAIELAATRMRTMAIDDLLDRLATRFTLLSGAPRNTVERQRTLRAVVDWSYDLCSPPERELWSALSIFSGTFDLDAAIAVADMPESDVVDTIDLLVAQSIVSGAEDTGHFHLLETIRRYGRERAEESALWPLLVRRHLAYIQRMATDVRLSWWGPSQAEKVDRMRRQAVEIQSALATATAVTPDAALKLFTDLRYHWAVGGFLREGMAWGDRLLARADQTGSSHLEATLTAAWLCLLQGDQAAASARLFMAESILTSTDLSDLPLTTVLTARIELDRWRGTLSMFSGDPVRAQDHFERSIAAAMDAELPAEALLAQFQLTTARSHVRRADAAGPAHDALAYAESIGETWMRAHALWSLALASFVQGDLSEAENFAHLALIVDEVFDDPLGLCLRLEVLSWVDARRGMYERSATLLGAASTQWRRMGTDLGAMGPQLNAHYDECVDTLRHSLGARRFAQLGDVGAAMTPDAVLQLALAPAHPPAHALSDRESEVARGIHRGLSNREIADELVLSTRTVDTHVQRIFAKLEVTSRAQVAVWFESTNG